MRQESLTLSYLRTKKKFPSVWCPGCSLGIIMGALIRAINQLGLSQDEIVLTSGIGCTGRMPVYTDFNTLHGTHGRALAFATGVKLANPELKVIAVMGDGDATAIGGNHFIHTARRNIDITVIVANNYIYGMTGGQHSPTTLPGMKASTAPYGMLEAPFDICELARGAGAPFVARTTSYHAAQMTRLFVQALGKKGMGVVEVISHCYTTAGRRNGFRGPVEMMTRQKELAVPLKDFEKKKAQDPAHTLAEGEFLTGVFVDIDRPEFCEVYGDLRRRLREGS